MTTTISKRRKAFANKVDRAKAYPALDAPATPERLLAAVRRVRGQ